MKLTALILLCIALLTAKAAEQKMIPFEEIRAKWGALPMAQVEAAANAGDASAQHYLGRVHMDAEGRPRDRKLGAQWYEKAVAQEFPNSQLNLGRWLYWGEKGSGSDPKRGLDLLRKAAEATGAPNAHHFLAEALVNEGNPAEAAENFEKAAAAGITDSMLRLAELHSSGIIERDYDKAYAWLKKAADAGDTRAMATLSDFLKNNYETFPARPEEANAWREKALANGYRFATNRNVIVARSAQPAFVENAGEILAQADKLDQGDLPDRRRAFELYLKIAHQEPKAALKVAQAYESGELAPKDDRKALSYYTRSYALGNWPEIEDASLRLIEAGRGLGTPEENRHTVNTFTSRGYNRPPGIAFRIGRLFDEDKVVPADLTIATRFYRDAAIKGSAEARNRLGELWLEGVNGQPDREEAAKWFRSAAEAGYAPAQKNLQRLNAKQSNHQ